MDNHDEKVSHEVIYSADSPLTKGKQMRGILKFIKWLLILGLAACIFVAGVNGWMIHSTKDAIFSLDEADQLTGDCILVLGCGIRSDGKPSHMLQDRLDVAIAAYQMGLAPQAAHERRPWP